MESLKNLKIELPSDPAILFLGIFLKGSKISILKRYVPCSLKHYSHSCQDAGNALSACPQMKWIKNMCMYVCVYTVEYHSAMTKQENLPFAVTWINLEGIRL